MICLHKQVLAEMVWKYRFIKMVKMRPNLGRISFTRLFHRLQDNAAFLHWRRDGRSAVLLSPDSPGSEFGQPHRAKGFMFRLPGM